MVSWTIKPLAWPGLADDDDHLIDHEEVRGRESVFDQGGGRPAAVCCDL